MESQDANIYVSCVEGKWFPKIPVCRKMCSPLASLSLDTRCVNKSGEVDCSKPMHPGTQATVQCKPSYVTTSPYPYKEIFCTDKGQWSGEWFYCEPACGRRNWKGVNTSLMAQFSAAKHVEFPWHVGLYRRNSSNQWEYRCGGSLISPHIVVTAAYCVSQLPPEYIKVGLGKYYRDWTHEEPYAVQADVREVLIPPRYNGSLSDYALDIALLDLTRSIQLNAGIMPVCVDWKQEFTITPGALGTLAGWGFTEHYKLSDVLLLVDLPYVDHFHCINQVPPESQRWVTSDQFCGGYTNGTRTGFEYAGYAGGGLTFVQDDLYYVYGIASSLLQYGNNSITTFTNITNEEIFNWLISSKNKFDKEHDEEYPESSPSPPEVGCLLPQPPEFGAYTSQVCQIGNNTAACSPPGTPVPQNWLLSFKCNEGYYLMESQDANIYVFCVEGKWSPKIPVCRKMCSPLASLSLDTRCVNKSGEVDCSKPMRPGTRATVQCKTSYITTSPYPYKEIFCTDKGQWSGEWLYCEPACGRRNWKGVNTPLIAHGSAAKHGELPWHVGVYWRNEYNQWFQYCGGSLISPHIVLTAAFCVIGFSPEEFKVGLGKYYREWTHEEPYAVQADVREILIPPGYTGRGTDWRQNIALLDLTRSVQLHAGIMPVCVDWQREFTITPGALGTLAGWGYTEHKTRSDVLLLVDVPIVDHSHCINQVPEKYQRYVTLDKFCGGYTNGTGARQGDFGGGLTFVQDDLYYVFGISSYELSDISTALFTNITNEEILTWLISSKNKLDKEHDKEYPEK